MVGQADLPYAWLTAVTSVVASPATVSWNIDTR
jgi:hypothetical protein